MNILLSNDDGILAPGLAALAGVADELGDLTIVAPDSPQSAMAHSITLTRPLTVQYVRIPGQGALEGMSVDGRPADCVRLAIRNLLPARPDLAVSGINAGANVGVNVFYSGTVAAAAEAAMMGIPAVAFSVAIESFRNDTTNYPRIAGLCGELLQDLLAMPLLPGDLINVNLPVLADGQQPKGVQWCEQSDADVDDRYILEESPEGLQRYHLSDEFDFRNPHPESDVWRLREGYITITPLRTSLTNHTRLNELRDAKTS